MLTDGIIEEFDLRKAVGLRKLTTKLLIRFVHQKSRLVVDSVNIEFYARKTDIICPLAISEGKPFVLNMPGRYCEFLVVQAGVCFHTSIF